MKAGIHAIAVTALLVAHAALADESSKAAKLNELMVLQGHEESTRHKLETYKRQSMEMGARAMEQYRAHAGMDANDCQYAQLQKAYQRFLDEALPPWTGEEATRMYAELLARDLTESDIDALLEFYRSPVGRKASAVATRAGMEIYDILGRKAQDAIVARYKDLVGEMARIASDHHAERCPE